MPVELQVIRASEFIRLGADEHLDLETSKEALRALTKACRKRGLDCAMLDLRMLPVLAKPHFTTSQLAALVGTFRETGFSRQQRLAILYRHDIHGGIRDFAFISRMRGLQVQAFGEFESAMHWLSGAQAERGEHLEQGVAIPIAKRPGGAKRIPAHPAAESGGRSAPRPVRGMRTSGNAQAGMHQPTQQKPPHKNQPTPRKP